MRGWMVFFLMILVPLAYAQEEYQSYESLGINTRVENDIILDEGVNYLSSEIFFFPKGAETQSIEKKEYSGRIVNKEDSILFEWTDPGEELNIYMDYDLKNEFNMPEIKNRILFPIQVPDEYKDYLMSTSLINSDHLLIRQKAQEIIGDENDLYGAVYKVASWTKGNIKYSLDTLTEEVTQNSLWVLQNREGVCDELTVLFIAMLRSQGIPARFISGQSYTNVIPGFGNHAWAEVYFPGKGWVPFDVTYGQYGYVDATHIKMRESVDAKETSANYRWSPAGKKINVGSLNISSSITSVGSKLPDYVNMNLNLLKNNVKFGSFVPVEIEMENTRDYYISSVLYLTKAPKEVESNIKTVLLKPNEKKKVYWILQVPDNMDDSYIYTSNIEIINFFGSSDSVEVEYSGRNSYYSLKEAEEKVYQLELENRKPELGIDMFCTPERLKYYSYENATVNCRITNSEKISYHFGLCFFESCSDVVVNPDDGKIIKFNLPLSVGNNEYHVTAEGDGLLRSSYFDVNVAKIPEFVVSSLYYPNEIKYKDKDGIKFDLFTESQVRNLVIRINKDALFTFDVYGGRENFVVPFNGKYFYNKNQKIILEYEDDNGIKYSAEQEIAINVTDVPFYIRMGYWWFLIIFLLIILFVFRKRFLKMKEPPKPIKKK